MRRPKLITKTKTSVTFLAIRSLAVLTRDALRRARRVAWTDPAYFTTRDRYERHARTAAAHLVRGLVPTEAADLHRRLLAHFLSP